MQVQPGLESSPVQWNAFASLGRSKCPEVHGGGSASALFATEKCNKTAHHCTQLTATLLCLQKRRSFFEATNWIVSQTNNVVPIHHFRDVLGQCFLFMESVRLLSCWLFSAVLPEKVIGNYMYVQNIINCQGSQRTSVRRTIDKETPKKVFVAGSSLFCQSHDLHES